MMRRADVLLALSLFAMFAAMAIHALHWRWEVALGPLVAAIPGGLLCLAVAGKALMEQPSEGGTRDAYDTRDARSAGVFLVAVACILIGGFTIGGAFFVLWHALVIARMRPLAALLFAAPVPFITEIVVGKGLGVPLFEGWLGLM